MSLGVPGKSPLISVEKKSSQVFETEFFESQVLVGAGTLTVNGKLFVRAITQLPLKGVKHIF